MESIKLDVVALWLRFFKSLYSLKGNLKFSPIEEFDRDSLSILDLNQKGIY